MGQEGVGIRLESSLKFRGGGGCLWVSDGQGESAKDQIGAKDVMNCCQHLKFSVNYAYFSVHHVTGLREEHRTRAGCERSNLHSPLSTLL
jgi:hypothetical protein